MPLEIKELHIKATVGEETSGGQASTPSNAEGGGADMINECVDKIMKMIRDRSVR